MSIKEKISLDQAATKIKLFVEQINATLASNHECELKGLGTFLLQNAKLFFTPDNAINFNIEGFGLDSFVSDPIQTSTDFQVKELTKTKQENVLTKSNKKNTLGQKKNKFKLLTFILPFFVMIGIVSFFYKNEKINLFSKQEVSHTKNGVTKKDAASMVNSFSDSEEYKSGNTMTEPLQVLEIPKQEEVLKISETKSTNSAIHLMNFHVIAAVFGTQKNAERFMLLCPTANILEIDGMYKVSVANFETMKEAKQFIPSLEEKFGAELWILKQK